MQSAGSGSCWFLLKGNAIHREGTCGFDGGYLQSHVDSFAATGMVIDTIVVVVLPLLLLHQKFPGTT
jgi:hypothetical protein